MANPFKVPLNAIRAIEIVGRDGTLSLAAAELGVTPGAVSQHIRRAEERLGYVLFERTREGMRPTAALEAALPHFRQGFRALADGIAAIEQSHSGTLTLTAAPAFAARWLVPRLGRFTREHPEIEIRFAASVTLVDLNHSDIDCAIRLGKGDWPDVEAEKLLAQPFFPVATPEWAERLKAPADLANVPIIHDEGTMVAWRDWFEAAGLEMRELAGPRFSDPILALEAVMAGQGVMLAWDMVVADALALGRLVRPFDIAVESCLAYWFVTTAASARSRKVRLFRDWLKREIAATGGRAA
ncbi:LysR substrate-binding domain-containing protein [Kaistia geumhonensis]|nr:LysR substrate-binding domain-containing protein [Kaistia geumhonensis]MCX5479450.1 LysR substrate-binding domain-containing protein [Kaistia geumhonensis]